MTDKQSRAIKRETEVRHKHGHFIYRNRDFWSSIFDMDESYSASDVDSSYKKRD